MKVLVAALVCVCPLLALAAPGTGPDDILMGPWPLEKNMTYMVSKSDVALVMEKFPDVQDCARFATPLKAECISGEEAINRYPLWALQRPNQ